MTTLSNGVKEKKIYPPLSTNGTPVTSTTRLEEYNRKYEESVDNPEKFWGETANAYLNFFHPFSRVMSGSFQEGDIAWFLEGKLNACYNCIDRHLPQRMKQTAIIWQGDEVNESQHITYETLLLQVSRIANVLLDHGVCKGDVVTIYLPMIPAVAMTMLACARIGAIHSVVFAGFSAESLKDRILDCSSKFLVTSPVGRRGGKDLKLKSVAVQSIQLLAADGHGELVQKLFVFSYPNQTASTTDSDDSSSGSLSHRIEVDMSAALLKARPVCPCVWMDSEDLLFILYTSGSTGKPKGVAHSTAGYLLNAMVTMDNSFDIQGIRNLKQGKEEVIHGCVADAGWITGHTYIIYGPLALGLTTVFFESIPTYPNPYRYWDVVQRHRLDTFYTAPTAIRALMRYDSKPIADYDLTSLKCLGTVGEPINPEAWRWYYEHVGRGQCSLSDTYWQTESGGHIMVNQPGVHVMKPSSCARPCLGMAFRIMDPVTGRQLHPRDEAGTEDSEEVEGVLCISQPWPSMARTVYGDHERFMNVYLRPFPGYYVTSDGARRDRDGYYFITGRVDDVICPSGHRIGSAEVESALVNSGLCAEAACIGFPHDIRGEGIGCFVIPKESSQNGSGLTNEVELITAMKLAVRVAIGPIATPDFIVCCDLPKTRSGKIMRRILRKVATGELDSIGDTSTLADPAVVERLVVKFAATVGAIKTAASVQKTDSTGSMSR